MSYHNYTDDVKGAHWQQKYLQSVNTLETGIVQPKSHSMTPEPSIPYLLNVSNTNEHSGLYTNPAASLYSQGHENQVLLSSSSKACDGCLGSLEKPDPRVHQTKPLYKASIFTASEGQVLPTASNVTGMY